MARDRLVEEIEAVLEDLRVRLGGLRATLRLDDPARGWHSDDPCAETLAPGAPSMRGEGTISHRAAGTIVWLEKHRTILAQPDLAMAEARPPQALIEAYGARSQIIAPVERDGAMVGWVSIHSPEAPRPWGKADRQAMRDAVAAVSRLLAAPG